MNKDQLVELILEYEKGYEEVNNAYDLPIGVVSKKTLQDKIKDNFWFLFSGQYSLFLDRTLTELFKYDLSSIIKHLIFVEKLENMPLYVNLDADTLDGLYSSVLYKERSNFYNGYVFIELNMIKITVDWRLRHNLKKGDFDV